METIFVSSTFQDMQFERDAIREIVIPRLNTIAHEYGQSVSVCDLRWGINTEELATEQMNRKVLSVCLDEIDRSDPPMIIILGNRYGWIPPEGLIREMCDHKNVRINESDLSVTALEIRYGCFACNRNSFFYFRNVHGEVPDTSYLAEDDFHSQKQAALKEEIRKSYTHELKEYDLHFERGTASGEDIKAFAETVFEDIRSMLLPKWQEDAKASPLVKEKRVHMQFVKEKNDLLYARKDLQNEFIEKITKGQKLTVIKGNAGTGKSTLLSGIAKGLEERDWNIIPVISGQTSGTTTAFDVLRFVTQCVEDLNGAADSEDHDNSAEVWRDRLDAACVRYAKTNDKPLCILVDAVDQLIPDEYRDEMVFIPRVDTNGIAVVLTALPHITRFSEITYELTNMSDADRRQVVSGFLSNHHKELPESVIKAVTSISGNPLYINLLLQRLMMMDRSDFDDIRSKGGGMRAITARQLEIIKELPDGVNTLSAYVLDFAGTKINVQLVRRSTEYMALSRYGLREDDLAGLAGDNWNYLDFAQMISLMNENFIKRSDGRYDFMHASFRYGITNRITDITTLHNDIFSGLLGLDVKDPVRKAEVIYHGILAEQYEPVINLICDCYVEDRTDYLRSAAENMYYLCMHNQNEAVRNLIISAGDDLRPEFAGFLMHYFEQFFSNNASDAKAFMLVAESVKELLSSMANGDQHETDGSYLMLEYETCLAAAVKSKLIPGKERKLKAAEDFKTALEKVNDAGRITRKEYALGFYNYIVLIKDLLYENEQGLRAFVRDVESKIDKGLIDDLPAENRGPLCGCMGELYSYLRDLDKTYEMYSKDLSFRKIAAETDPTKDNMILLGGGYGNVGMALALLHRPAEALAMYDKCDEILSGYRERIDDELLYFDYYNTMCICYMMMFDDTGNTENLDKALECQTKSLLLSRRDYKKTGNYIKMDTGIISNLGAIAFLTTQQEPWRKKEMKVKLLDLAQKLLVEDAAAFASQPTEENRNYVIRMFDGFIQAARKMGDEDLTKVICSLYLDKVTEPMIRKAGGLSTPAEMFEVFLDYFNAASMIMQLEINNKLKNPALCNTAISYIRKGLQALNQHERSLKDTSSLYRWYAYTYDKLAYFSTALNKRRDALYYFKEARAYMSRNPKLNNQQMDREWFANSRRLLKAYEQAALAEEEAEKKAKADKTMEIQPELIEEKSSGKANGVAFPDDTVYDGETMNGLRHGTGIYKWKNGKGIYHGGWVNDLKEGYGETIFPNGSKYYGEWKKGKPDGYGIKTLASGKVICGIWKSGDLIKEKSKLQVIIKLSHYPDYGLR